MTTTTTFAERLRTAMAEADVNQTELAMRAGVSKAAVSQYLSGKNEPNAARMKTIADILGVTYNYMLGYGEDKAAALPARKISVRDAARCMGKSDQFIRVGLQRGFFPFGLAVPGTGERWTYYINPAKFRAFVGCEEFDRYFKGE